MVTQPPARFRPRRAKIRPSTLLRLVAADYLSANWVRLTFDRAVDAAALVANQITFVDQPAGGIYQGTGAATMVGPQTVQVALTPIGMTGGSERLLTATAGTGIVAEGGGAAWAGVTDLPLPFP